MFQTANVRSEPFYCLDKPCCDPFSTFFLELVYIYVGLWRHDYDFIRSIGVRNLSFVSHGQRESLQFQTENTRESNRASGCGSLHERLKRQYRVSFLNNRPVEAFKVNSLLAELSSTAYRLMFDRNWTCDLLCADLGFLYRYAQSKATGHQTSITCARRI